MVPDEKTGQYVLLERVSEYASGKVGEIVPPDGCRTLPANSMIKWDVHYWPFGEEVKDDVVELGIWLYPEDHKAKAKYKQDLKLYTLLMKGGELEIPPHGTAMTQGFHSFKTPGPHRQLPAARPRAPRGDDGRDLLPGHGQAGDGQLGLQLDQPVAHQPRVRRRLRAAAARRARSWCSRAITTTRRRTRGTPIPTSGWAAEAARRTRCRTPGLRSLTWTTRATSRSSPTGRAARRRRRPTNRTDQAVGLAGGRRRCQLKEPLETSRGSFVLVRLR